MGIEDTLDAERIVAKTGMNTRPGYYSGRGATSTDLSSDKLERMHKLLEHHHGTDAANNFVHMVAANPT